VTLSPSRRGNPFSNPRFVIVSGMIYICRSAARGYRLHARDKPRVSLPADCIRVEQYKVDTCPQRSRRGRISAERNRAETRPRNGQRFANGSAATPLRLNEIEFALETAAVISEFKYGMSFRRNDIRSRRAANFPRDGSSRLLIKRVSAR